MAKLGLVSSVQLWIEMRDQRNRIVHEYLPEKIRQIYEELAGKMSKELLAVKKTGGKIRFAGQ